MTDIIYRCGDSIILTDNIGPRGPAGPPGVGAVDQFPIQAGAPTTPIAEGVYTYLDTLTGNMYKNVLGAWVLVYTIGQQILNSFNSDYNGDFS